MKAAQAFRRRNMAIGEQHEANSDMEARANNLTYLDSEYDSSEARLYWESVQKSPVHEPPGLAHIIIGEHGSYPTAPDTYRWYDPNAEAGTSEETVAEQLPTPVHENDEELAPPSNMVDALQPSQVQEGDRDDDFTIDDPAIFENLNKQKKAEKQQDSFYVLKQVGDETIGVTERGELYEAHVWVNNTKLPHSDKNGAQIFLGAFSTKEQAQHVHDRAAIKFKKTEEDGSPYTLNFPESRQADFMANVGQWPVRDFVWSCRRSAHCHTRGQVLLKGVITRKDKYEAKISVTDGQKDEWTLGRFDTAEEAARAYDKALLFLNRKKHVVKKLVVITNFRPSLYTTSEIQELAAEKLKPKKVKPVAAEELKPKKEKPKRKQSPSVAAGKYESLKKKQNVAKR